MGPIRLAVLATAAFQLIGATPVDAGCAIKVHNCRPDNGSLVIACVYKSSDSFHWVNQGRLDLKPGEKGTLSCSTSKCDIDVGYAPSLFAPCSDGLLDNVCFSNVYFYDQGRDVKSVGYSADISCKNLCNLENGCDGPIP